MNPEVGLFAGLLAWVLAVICAGLAVVRVGRSRAEMPAAADSASQVGAALMAATQQAQAVCALIALGSLAAAFLSDDFSVAYAAEMSSSALPAAWKIDAMLSGLPGLGLLAAALFSLAGLAISVRLPDESPRRWIAAVGSSATASAVALAVAASGQLPFARLVPAAAEGQGAALARRVAQGYELAPAAEAGSVWVLLPSLQAALPIIVVATVWGLGWAWWTWRAPGPARFLTQP